MNRKNVQKLRDHLANLPKRQFNMGSWVINLDQKTKSVLGQAFDLHYLDWNPHSCGTVACLAGWAALLSGRRNGYVDDVAEEWLEIPREDSSHVFYGCWTRETFDYVSSDDAVKYLNKVLETGRWDVRI